MRNVVFDVGGVLLDWNPDAILEGHFADPHQRASLKADLFNHPDWLDLDRGTQSESEVIPRLAARTGLSPSQCAALFETVRRSLRPKTATVELLEALAQRGIPLYCLSNMPATTFAYLRDRHNFWTAFRGIVISGEIGLIKPERAIFEYLLRTHGIAARDSVFIDDHAPNVEAARSLGFHAICFRNARDCGVELEHWLACDAP